MSDDTSPPCSALDPLDELRDRAALLERQLADVQQRAETRLVRAELKAEAIRAGIIDLDGLKLIDLTQVRLGASGEVENASALMTELKKAKPWLFLAPSLSSTAMPPPAQAPRQKLATEMTDAEYRAAREILLRNRG
jgi:hypothetical protein